MNVKGFVGIALIGLALAGCQPMNSLIGTSVPYGKETQLAYFEGQGHLLKGDYEDAYASFLSCACAAPITLSFPFPRALLHRPARPSRYLFPWSSHT